MTDGHVVQWMNLNWISWTQQRDRTLAKTQTDHETLLPMCECPHLSILERMPSNVSVATWPCAAVLGRLHALVRIQTVLFWQLYCPVPRKDKLLPKLRIAGQTLVVSGLFVQMTKMLNVNVRACRLWSLTSDQYLLVFVWWQSEKKLWWEYVINKYLAIY